MRLNVLFETKSSAWKYRDEIVELHRTMSLDNTAKELFLRHNAKISPSQIRRVLIDSGIEMRRRNPSKSNPGWEHQNEIVELYKELSTYGITKIMYDMYEIVVHPLIVGYILKDAGVKMRPRGGGKGRPGGPAWDHQDEIVEL
jgi:hypothetical protein